LPLGAPLGFFSVMFYFEHAIDQEEGSELPVFLLDGDVKKRHLHLGDIIEGRVGQRKGNFVTDKIYKLSLEEIVIVVYTYFDDNKVANLKL